MPRRLQGSGRHHKEFCPEVKRRFRKFPGKRPRKAPLFLDKPSNFKSTVVYDPDKDEYVLYEKVGAARLPDPGSYEPRRSSGNMNIQGLMRDYWESQDLREGARMFSHNKKENRR